MPFRIERLAKHNRTNFDCGIEILNWYLQKQANQDQSKRYSVCFLAIDDANEKVAGFYTLSSGCVDLDRLPDELAKRLPRYPAAPVVTMGRLAVDRAYQGSGLARSLLVDAIYRVQKLEIGAFALTVDAKDEESEAFYLHHGFVKLESREGSGRTLALPVAKQNFDRLYV